MPFISSWNGQSLLFMRCILRYEWTYQTSKWIREVRAQNGIEIH